MRGASREVRDDAQSSVAAAFDVRGSGFAQQSEVAGEPLRVQALDAAQAVEVRGDFLVVVENPRDVCGERLACAVPDHSTGLTRESQGGRATAEHVD